LGALRPRNTITKKITLQHYQLTVMRIADKVISVRFLGSKNSPIIF
jgi:hypothetical protein